MVYQIPIYTCKSHYSGNGSVALHSISAAGSIMHQSIHWLAEALQLLTIEWKLQVERHDDDCWFLFPIPNTSECLEILREENEQYEGFREVPTCTVIFHLCGSKLYRIKKESWISLDNNKQLHSVLSPDRWTVFLCFLNGSSDDPIVSERLQQHCVLDVAEDPADVFSVCSTGEVGVEHLPLLPLVKIDGLLLVQLTDVILCILGVLLFTWRRGQRDSAKAKDEFLAGWKYVG